jgi:GNAT superfamily N-acetyltransferase
MLFRGAKGELIGFLRHHPNGDQPGCKIPGEHTFHVQVAHRGRGIGRSLLAEADRRWNLDFSIQSYTMAGRALAVSYLVAKEVAQV